MNIGVLDENVWFVIGLVIFAAVAVGILFVLHALGLFTGPGIIPIGVVLAFAAVSAASRFAVRRSGHEP